MNDGGPSSRTEGRRGGRYPSGRASPEATNLLPGKQRHIRIASSPPLRPPRALRYPLVVWRGHTHARAGFVAWNGRPGARTQLIKDALTTMSPRPPPKHVVHNVQHALEGVLGTWL